MTIAHTPAVAHSAYDTWLGIFVAREKSDLIEVLLPYRDEFEGTHGEPGIASSIVTALADVTTRLIADRLPHVGGTKPLHSLHIEHKAHAAVGNELRSYGRITGQQIEIRIVTNDDQQLIAQARATFTASAATPTFPEQPIYPN